MVEGTQKFSNDFYISSSTNAHKPSLLASPKSFGHLPLPNEVNAQQPLDLGNAKRFTLTRNRSAALWRSKATSNYQRPNSTSQHKEAAHVKVITEDAVQLELDSEMQVRTEMDYRHRNAHQRKSLSHLDNHSRKRHRNITTNKISYSNFTHSESFLQHGDSQTRESSEPFMPAQSKTMRDFPQKAKEYAYRVPFEYHRKRIRRGEGVFKAAVPTSQLFTDCIVSSVGSMRKLKTDATEKALKQVPKADDGEDKEDSESEGDDV